MIYQLICHRDTPAAAIEHVSVQVDRHMRTAEELVVEYHVRSSGTLKLPAEREPSRVDELWKTTCFELFIQRFGEESYVEFNLSPSFEWAAYAFDRYRHGLRPHPLAWEPDISITPTDGRHFFLYAELDASILSANRALMALSAVIEEIDGTKSYWALAHPPGAPDFHHPACFAATLPAPARP